MCFSVFFLKVGRFYARCLYWNHLSVFHNCFSKGLRPSTNPSPHYHSLCYCHWPISSHPATIQRRNPTTPETRTETALITTHLAQSYPRLIHHFVPPVSSQQELWRRLGRLFVGFFHFYAQQFPWDLHVVCLRVQTLVTRHGQVPSNARPRWLCCQWYDAHKDSLFASDHRLTPIWWHISESIRMHVLTTEGAEPSKNNQDLREVVSRISGRKRLIRASGFGLDKGWHHAPLAVEAQGEGHDGRTVFERCISPLHPRLRSHRWLGCIFNQLSLRRKKIPVKGPPRKIKFYCPAPQLLSNYPTPIIVIWYLMKCMFI